MRKSIVVKVYDSFSSSSSYYLTKSKVNERKRFEKMFSFLKNIQKRKEEKNPRD
jgi:hypothetical protein